MKKSFQEYLSIVQEDVPIDIKQSSEANSPNVLIYIEGKPYKKFPKNMTLGEFLKEYNTEFPNEKITTVNGAKLSDTLGTLLLPDNKVEFSKVVENPGKPNMKGILTYKK